MRSPLTLLLFSLAILGTLIQASPVGAQIAVTEEVTGQPCSEVTLDADHNVTGGCPVHISSEQETQIVVGTAGGPILISTCEDEFEAAIDGSGEGYMYAISITGHQAPEACTRTACDEAAPGHDTIPWPIHIRENPDVINISFCRRNSTSSEGTSGTPCTWSIPWTQISGPHRLSFNAESGTPCLNLPAGAVTYFGHWHTVPDAEHPEIVVSH